MTEVLQELFLLIIVETGKVETMLKTQGKRIVDENGNNVILRGFTIGNWLMLEAYMLGFSGVEQKLREHIERIGGIEKKDYFLISLLKNMLLKKTLNI